jgi:hypothetical protein
MRDIVSPLAGFASPFGPQRGFNPLRLFANDEPGAWFEANDATTLFTDTAGTTPVTAPGDAIALQLDKSQGLTLGPELVTNGGFDTDTDWTLDAASSISGGVLSTTKANAGEIASQVIPISAGKVYFVQYTVLSTNGEIIVPRLSGNSASSAPPTTTTGTFQAVITAVSDVDKFAFNVAATGVTATIDNISVRELKGNHRTQATTAARPLYALHPVGGVRNLLEYTEEFDNEVWIKNNATVTANATTAPDGTTTAEKLVENTATGEHGTLQAIAAPVGDKYFSMYVKAAERDQFQLLVPGTVAYNFDLTAETATGLGEITAVGDGWYRCGFPFNRTTVLTQFYIRFLVGGTNIYAGDGTSGLFIWGAQVEEGSTATNYQRVGSFLDVSEEGKARRGRIWYNGTSHFMQTGTITPGTDKVQVFAGVRKLSDAVGMVVELSSNWAVNQGSLSLQAGTQTGSAGSLYYYSSARGDASATTTQGGEWQTADVSPDTAVLTGTHDIAGDLSTIRRNGVAGKDGTADKGTGNFLAYPLYFGARGGTSLFFNGYEDTSIIRFGPNLDADTISKVESYVASKTPESTL